MSYYLLREVALSGHSNLLLYIGLIVKNLTLTMALL
jgi:hypothetical protein